MSSIVGMVLIVNYYCTGLLIFSSSDGLFDSANKYFSASFHINGVRLLHIKRLPPFEH